MKSLGFTLVELLVVIAIMAVIGAVGFANFQTLGKDQELAKAAGNLADMLRSAQTNATTGSLCDDQGGATWVVTIVGARSINLDCSTANNSPINLADPPLAKAMDFGSNNIEIFSVVDQNNCTTYYDYQISFDPVTGKINFSAGVDPSDCMPNSAYLDITLKNTSNSSTKVLRVNKGGSIEIR